MVVPRRTPPDRLRDVARAACEVFVEKGYRRTLMTDIGARLELSHALLYRYVESKEALFELALVYAMDPDSAASSEVPIRTPPPGRFLELVRRWGSANATFPVLAEALRRGEPSEPIEELSAVIDERYDFIETNRLLLSLLERSAIDLPELHALYFRGGRRRQLDDLSRYLEKRITTGHFQSVPDTRAAARFVVESIAWFAWHRTRDREPDPISDDTARQTVKALLLQAFLYTTTTKRARTL